MQEILNPITYIEKILLTYFITAVTYLFFIFIRKTKFEIKKGITLKVLFSCILIGIGVCLFHRIIFIIFPQIGLSLFNKIGIDAYENMLYSFKNPLTFIYISIIGPILEELFYRGKLLNECLKKNKPVHAVIITSILFAVSHMNIVQFVNGICLGMLCGMVFVIYKDIKASIIVHVANNLFSSVMSLKLMSYEADSISELKIISDIVIGLILLLCGLKMCINESKKKIP